MLACEFTSTSVHHTLPCISAIPTLVHPTSFSVECLPATHSHPASQMAQMVKNLLYNMAGLIPGSGRSPGEGNGYPVFLPGKSHGQRSLVSYNPWGLKESDTNEHVHTYHHPDIPKINSFLTSEFSLNVTFLAPRLDHFSSYPFIAPKSSMTTSSAVP